MKSEIRLMSAGALLLLLVAASCQHQSIGSDQAPGSALQLPHQEGLDLLGELRRDLAQHAALVLGDVRGQVIIGAEEVVIEDRAPCLALLGREVLEVQQAVDEGIEGRVASR